MDTSDAVARLNLSLGRHSITSVYVRYDANHDPVNAESIARVDGKVFSQMRANRISGRSVGRHEAL